MPATAPMTAASSNDTAIAPFGSKVYSRKNRRASASSSTDVILPKYEGKEREERREKR